MNINDEDRRGYRVPLETTRYRDKIGPLTIRQWIIVLIGSGLGWLIYLRIHFWIRYPLLIIIFFGVLGFGFYVYEDRELGRWFIDYIKYRRRPRERYGSSITPSLNYEWFEERACEVTRKGNWLIRRHNGRRS